MYGHSGPIRSGSSNSSSPGGANGHATTPAALLVVPQPINASKINTGLTNGTGPGRKYQCKMCPQVFMFSLFDYVNRFCSIFFEYLYLTLRFFQYQLKKNCNKSVKLKMCDGT